MAYAKKQNTGTLGKNKDKQKDTHPDYRGTINVDGKDYWLSGWTKENGSTGEKFFSLAVKAKEEKKEEAADYRGNTPNKNDMDDEIPF